MLRSFVCVIESGNYDEDEQREGDGDGEEDPEHEPVDDQRHLLPLVVHLALPVLLLRRVDDQLQVLEQLLHAAARALVQAHVTVRGGAAIRHAPPTRAVVRVCSVLAHVTASRDVAAIFGEARPDLFLVAVFHRSDARAVGLFSFPLADEASASDEFGYVSEYNDLDPLWNRSLAGRAVM